MTSNLGPHVEALGLVMPLGLQMFHLLLVKVLLLLPPSLLPLPLLLLFLLVYAPVKKFFMSRTGQLPMLYPHNQAWKWDKFPHQLVHIILPVLGPLDLNI